MPYHRLGHLQKAEQRLEALNNQRLGERSALAYALEQTVAVWQEVLGKLRAEAEAAATGMLPNPFRAGDPLNPDEGREVFRGREELIKRIKTLLPDPQQSASIALIGPRRCGKTSLLKMLPVMLPVRCACSSTSRIIPLALPRPFSRH